MAALYASATLTGLTINDSGGSPTTSITSGDPYTATLTIAGAPIVSGGWLIRLARPLPHQACDGGWTI